MLIVRSKNPRGIALLEGVIAIGVILTGVVGSLVLVNTSINLGRANQDRIVGQSLAREGLEISYSLRNSGSLRKVDDPTVSWNTYLFEMALKTDDPTTYLKRYNLGHLVGGTTCKVMHSDPNDSTCTVAGENENVCTAEIDNTINEAGDRDCDVQVLVNYFFKGWPKPQGCDSVSTKISRIRIGTIDSNLQDCDYSDDGDVNIVDLVTLIDELYRQSFQFGFAYPSVATSLPNAGIPDGHLTFYNPVAAGKLSAAGVYTDTDHPKLVWEDSRAKIYAYAGTYLQLQNPPVGQPGVEQSKYYRVVTVQPICRGNKGSGDEEFVIPNTSAANCKDYGVNSLGWTNADPTYYANTLKLVGALVTSEVRWPKADSDTKVRYQEFLYDWISL